MWRVIHSLLLTSLLTAPLASALAQELSNDDIRKLDDEVQDVKSDVLNIVAELNILEERLLYPSGTRLSVTLSVGQREDVLLRAVEIEIDGIPAAHHIYTTRELEALQKGGVQSLYTGNVTSGKHVLGVKIIREFGDGSDMGETGRYEFTKGVEPKALGITLVQSGREDNGIRIGEL